MSWEHISNPLVVTLKFPVKTRCKLQEQLIIDNNHYFFLCRHGHASWMSMFLKMCLNSKRCSVPRKELASEMVLCHHLPHLSLCVCLCVCLSVSVLPLSLFVCVYVSVCLSICIYLWLSLFSLSLCVCLCVLVCLCLSVSDLCLSLPELSLTIHSLSVEETVTFSPLYQSSLEITYHSMLTSGNGDAGSQDVKRKSNIDWHCRSVSVKKEHQRYTEFIVLDPTVRRQ